MVRGVQAHAVGDLPEWLPETLIRPNPEPAQPPNFAIVSPMAATMPTIQPPHAPAFAAPFATAPPQNVAAGGLGVAVNAAIPPVDLVEPSALSTEILNGPWPAPGVPKSEGLPGSFMPEGAGTRPPYYLALNSTSTSPPTIEPLPKLTAEEEAALTAERSAAALDCVLGIWSDWSSCEELTDDDLHSRVQQRSRVIIEPQQPGGSACDPSNMTEISQCLSKAAAEQLQEELVPTEKEDDDAAAA